MIGYFACVVAGIALALAAARLQRDDSGLAPAVRARLLLAAVLGAILGAYGLQLPADLLGFHAPPPANATGAGGAALAGDALPLGGRTVLGGLIGGWLGVEFAKRQLGVRQPTGDGFALPLALALGCGRLGCLFAGCCAGVACAPSPFAYVDAAGTSRVPVQALEAAFHFAAAGALWLAARRGLGRGRRLAAYLALYAAVRFALEHWRLHPPFVLGLSWHQVLALALFALAGGTWWRRRRGVVHESPTLAPSRP